MLERRSIQAPGFNGQRDGFGKGSQSLFLSEGTLLARERMPSGPRATKTEHKAEEPGKLGVCSPFDWLVATAFCSGLLRYQVESSVAGSLGQIAQPGATCFWVLSFRFGLSKRGTGLQL